MNKTIIIAGIVLMLFIGLIGIFFAGRPGGSPQSVNQNTAVTIPAKSYTLSDIAPHAVPSDCWLAIGGRVYDATSYVSEHPGGARNITLFCGKDATAAFSEERKHGSSETQEALNSLIIGTLAG